MTARNAEYERSTVCPRTLSIYAPNSQIGARRRFGQEVVDPDPVGRGFQEDPCREIGFDSAASDEGLEVKHALQGLRAVTDPAR
jgi:hypothetical protein